MESKFVVESGSARGENITMEEVQQALRDISNWLQSNIPSISLPDGAIASPHMNLYLSAMLLQHNGGIQLQETFKTLSMQAIEESQKEVCGSANWNAGLTVFAKNNEGDFLVLSEVGEVVQWNGDEGVVDRLAKNLGLYLENLRNNMLSRKYQYLGEDCGLIEGV